ncbi:MAG TPA: LapA family protein [Solirubrobacteraceae bacterium]|nr:LapA family protein [Solirubrobacteraceae bacterium]
MSSERTDFEGLTQAPDSSLGERPPGRPPAERRERARLISAGVIGALITAFALLNLGDVKVHWLVATGRTPLIVVIALAFVLGMIVDRLVIRARRKRTH